MGRPSIVVVMMAMMVAPQGHDSPAGTRRRRHVAPAIAAPGRAGRWRILVAGILDVTALAVFAPILATIVVIIIIIAVVVTGAAGVAIGIVQLLLRNGKGRRLVRARLLLLPREGHATRDAGEFTGKRRSGAAPHGAGADKALGLNAVAVRVAEARIGHGVGGSGSVAVAVAVAAAVAVAPPVLAGFLLFFPLGGALFLFRGLLSRGRRRVCFTPWGRAAPCAASVKRRPAAPTTCACGARRGRRLLARGPPPFFLCGARAPEAISSPPCPIP